MSEIAPDETTTKPKRGRSPSYPSIDLASAVERARQLWEKERHQHPVSLGTVFKHWGYKSAGGNGNLTIAALKKFGLIDYEGSNEARKARLTDLAIEILNHPDPARKAQALKTAALLPPIHEDLWNLYGVNLPSDEHLRWELERERGFTPTGADEFMPQYRSTLTFAGLLPSDSADSPDARKAAGEVSEEHRSARGPDSQSDDKARQHGTRGSGSGNLMTIPVPIPGSSPITLELEVPITEQAFDLFIAVLQAMKPGLVASQPAQSDRDDA